MYMPWIAPIGAGGQPEPFVPRIMSDESGNPLPLQPEVPTAGQAVACLAAGSVAQPTIGTVNTAPVVSPWTDYGIPPSSGVPWRTKGRGSGYASSGESPWSDALEGRPPCCCGSGGGVLNIIQAHPWVTLGVVLAVVLVFQGADR